MHKIIRLPLYFFFVSYLYVVDDPYPEVQPVLPSAYFDVDAAQHHGYHCRHG